MAAKLDETRKYFNTYNTLERQHGLITKEASLLQSVVDGFGSAMAKKKEKDVFLRKLESIVAGLKKTKLQMEDQMRRKKDSLQEAEEANRSMMEKQRRYFKALKEFQEECDKNETLTIKLKCT